MKILSVKHDRHPYNRPTGLACIKFVLGLLVNAINTLILLIYLNFYAVLVSFFIAIISLLVVYLSYRRRVCRSPQTKGQEP